MRPGIWSDDWNSSLLTVASVQECYAPSLRQPLKTSKKLCYPSANKLTDTYVGQKKVEKKGD